MKSSDPSEKSNAAGTNPRTKIRLPNAKAPSILYEDNHLLAIWKPAGYLVQADATGDETLTDWGRDYLKVKYEKPGKVFLHPVHRLDRPVSGVVLFARTDKALSRLNELFRDKKMDKTYFAFVKNRPPQTTDRLVHFLDKNRETNTVRVWESKQKAPPEAKESILDYEWLGEFSGLNLLKIKPLTGRSHQIRVQLSRIGCPIVGDVKYGSPSPLDDGSIGLHSFSMAFEHPVKHEPITIRATLFPENPFWKSVDVRRLTADG